MDRPAPRPRGLDHWRRPVNDREGAKSSEGPDSGNFPTNLGGGYWGRVDRFPMGKGTDFEIHVMRGGKEVGVFGSSGWFPKHRHGIPTGVPDNVLNRLKGIAVDELRLAERLKPKGRANIKGENWKRPRLSGGC